MRASLPGLPLLVAALVLGACGGGGDDKSSAPRTVPFKPPTEKGVGATIREYLTALNNGDGKTACRLLDENGQASVIGFLPSTRRAIPCRKAVPRVARQVVTLRRFKIGKVKVSGRSATAEITATDPSYSSSVLLSNRGDGWKISYPPGLLSKSGGAPPKAVPGVPLERDPY
jgi:hypothetical protein